MNPDTTSIIRDIFLIAAAGLFAALCLILIALAVKLYRPLRDTARNAAKTAENLNQATSDIAAISNETAADLAQTSRNLVIITEKAKDSADEMSAVVHNAGMAAQSIAAAAHTIARIAEMVSQWTRQGTAAGSSSPSGIGALLRFLRSMFVDRRSNDNTGAGRRT